MILLAIRYKDRHNCRRFNRKLISLESSMAIKKSKKTIQKKQIMGREKQTRMQIVRSIAEETKLSNMHVTAVFSVLGDLLHAHMHKRGSGEFIIPFVGIKVKRVKKKATKSRTMVSPLTGQEAVIPGKPARHAIKLTALKPLKKAIVE